MLKASHIQGQLVNKRGSRALGRKAGSVDTKCRVTSLPLSSETSNAGSCGQSVLSLSGGSLSSGHSRHKASPALSSNASEGEANLNSLMVL